jgi:hypothetical protein
MKQQKKTKNFILNSMHNPIKIYSRIDQLTEPVNGEEK